MHGAPEDAAVVGVVLPVDVEVAGADVERAAVGQRGVGADLDLVGRHADHVVGAAVELRDWHTAIGGEEHAHAVDDAIGPWSLELGLGGLNARVRRHGRATRRGAARRGGADVRPVRTRSVRDTRRIGRNRAR